MSLLFEGPEHTCWRTRCAAVGWRATKSIDCTVSLFFSVVFGLFSNGPSFKSSPALLSLPYHCTFCYVHSNIYLQPLHFLYSALLRKPSLLLCDEVTSSVDALAEREIIDTLRKCSGKHLNESNSKKDQGLGEGVVEKQETGPVRILS